jgi:hypothetical protein
MPANGRWDLIRRLKDMRHQKDSEDGMCKCLTVQNVALLAYFIQHSISKPEHFLLQVRKGWKILMLWARLKALQF